MTDAAPLVEVIAANRRFGPVHAVAEVSMDLHPGEVVGLLGANGAGKTTLVRMILGLLRPTAGAVRLFGTPPTRAARRQVGYVPQTLGLYDDLTVAENLAFVAAAYGVRPPEGLDAYRDRLVGALPLGVQRRLAFTAALCHHPRLLVLDEPTSGVAPLERSRLWDTIRAAAADGAGVLVTTHFMDEAEQCDRLVVMADGAVRASGTVAHILGKASVAEIRTGQWSHVFAILDDAGVPVTLRGTALRVPCEAAGQAERVLAAHGLAADLRIVPATLEEVFARIVSRRGGAR